MIRPLKDTVQRLHFSKKNGPLLEFLLKLHYFFKNQNFLNQTPYIHFHTLFTMYREIHIKQIQINFYTSKGQHYGQNGQNYLSRANQTSVY